LVESKQAEANISCIFGLFVPGPATTKERKQTINFSTFLSLTGRVIAGGGQHLRHIRIIRHKPDTKKKENEFLLLHVPESDGRVEAGGGQHQRVGLFVPGPAKKKKENEL
jgi:hypothetical protein